MSRLFTFGCSFTQYHRWPTWADMIGRSFDQFENWGICGTGNAAILYNLMECDQRNKITADDTVIIMWTNTSREDRYVDNRWVEGGNVYWSAGSQYPKGWVEKFACERGYLIRDLAIISAVKKILESRQCHWKFLSMVPLYNSNELNGLGSNPLDSNNNIHDVVTLYKDVLDVICPSVFDVVFHGDWASRSGILDPGIGRRDFHPTPMEHIEYIDQVMPDVVISDETRSWAKIITQDMMAGKSFTWREPNRPHRL